MNLEPITWEKREPIQRLRRQYGHQAASHAFQSLYLWEKDMGLSVELETDIFAVKTLQRGENAWFFPCGSPQAKIDFLKRHLEEDDFLLCYAREEDAAFAQVHFPGKFSFEEKLGDGEYLYLRREQTLLDGHPFAKLRGRIHRVSRRLNLETQLLTDKNIQAAMEISAQWSRLSHNRGEEGLKDTEASKRFLSSWDELEATGVLILLDGEPYAFAGGFPLGEDVFDMCIAKQKCYPPGLSQYVKWQFCLCVPERYTWINGEEDLGIQGLRKMKELMRPADRIRMFEGRIEKG